MVILDANILHRAFNKKQSCPEARLNEKFTECCPFAGEHTAGVPSG